MPYSPKTPQDVVLKTKSRKWLLKNCLIPQLAFLARSGGRLVYEHLLLLLGNHFGLKDEK